MAQHRKGNKNKEEQNIKKDKEKKSASVKDDSRRSNEKQRSKSKCFKIVLFLVLIKIVLISIAAYKTYEHLTYVPELPNLELNQWWTDSDISIQDTSIRRFKPMFTDSMSEYLRRKFEGHREMVHRKKSINESWTYGIHSDAVGHLFGHWQYKYKFNEREKYLNKYEHFKTNIQGLDMHFVHVKPKVDGNVKVVPLLLLHGWPGTFRDFYDVIPLLTTVRPGYDFVFEVIVPSLPGFIYSQGPSKPGMGPAQVAVIMANLMQRLGLSFYYIHGSDFGHTIGSHMATLFPKNVLGFHTAFPVNFSKLSYQTWIWSGLWPSLVGQGLEDRMYPLKDKIEFFLEESGYMHLQGTKPDTIGIALSDSPLGLLAYLVDRIMIFTDPNNKFLEDGGLLKYYTMTDLIDQVMLYWTTNSITTALRLYKESFISEVETILAQIPSEVPTWGLRTKHELICQPDFMLRWKYPNLVGTTTLEFGGHFAAFERPVEVADDLFLSVEKFRALK